jgi:putative endonuclease
MAPLASPSRPPSNPRRELGEYGEALAARFLREQGMVILARNWRCATGEIDIVARDGDCLVVCEVKTRRGSRFGMPVEAVTWAKVVRLRRLAAAWLHADGARAGSVRIDVVGILVPVDGPPRVHHVPAVGS